MKAFDLEFEKLVQQFEKDVKGLGLGRGRLDREKDVAVTRKGQGVQV